MGIFSWLFGRKKQEPKEFDEKQIKSETEKKLVHQLKEVYHALERRPEMLEDINKLYHRAKVFWKLHFKDINKDRINAICQIIDEKIDEIKEEEIIRLIKQKPKKPKKAA